MPLTQGAKVFLGAGAVGGLGYYLFGRSSHTQSKYADSAKFQQYDARTRIPEAKFSEPIVHSKSIVDESGKNVPIGMRDDAQPFDVPVAKAQRILNQPQQQYQFEEKQTTYRSVEPNRVSGVDIPLTVPQQQQQQQQLKQGSSEYSYTYGGKTENAKDVLKSHAEAAKRDIKQTSSEAGTIARTHSELAKRDLSQMGSELKAAISGDVLPGKSVVRDTPDLFQSQPRDEVRVERNNSALNGRVENPSFLDRAKEVGDIIASHGKAALDDIAQEGKELGKLAGAHGELAKRDAKQANVEVKQASNGAPQQVSNVRDAKPLVGGQRSGVSKDMPVESLAQKIDRNVATENQ